MDVEGLTLSQVLKISRHKGFRAPQVTTTRRDNMWVVEHQIQSSIFLYWGWGENSLQTPIKTQEGRKRNVRQNRHQVTRLGGKVVSPGKARKM